MTHLGRLVSALVDGELSHDERDRALAHVATCEQCRAIVEAERALKATVGSIDVGDPQQRPAVRSHALGRAGRAVATGAPQLPRVGRAGARRLARPDPPAVRPPGCVDRRCEAPDRGAASWVCRGRSSMRLGASWAWRP